jgi:putative exporter of polyketide antibiotics
MSDAQQAALIGAVVAAVISGVFLLIIQAVSLLSDRTKRRAEERRWYAEFFLSRKVEALHNLYAAVVDSSEPLQSISQAN